MDSLKDKRDSTTWSADDSREEGKLPSLHHDVTGAGDEPGETVSRGVQPGASAAQAGAKAIGNVEPQAEKLPLDGKTSVRNVVAIPNGGGRAWLQVLGVWVLIFNTWGILNTYGVFQAYYETDLLKGHSPSDIAWIGSLQACLLFAMGALVGPLYDSGYFNHLLAVGSFLIVFGHMMLSLCKEYWQVLLAQGVCVGIGFGLTFLPGLAILSTYFTTKLPLAIGIAGSATGIGAVIVSIMLYKLIPTLGFPWTVRVIAFISLGMLVPVNLMMRTRILPDKRRALIEWNAFRDVPFLLYCCSALLGTMGYLIPYYFIPTFALEEQITSTSLAFYLIPIINAGSVPGRIIPPYIALKAGQINVYIICTALAGVFVYCFIPTGSYAGVVVVSVLYGFATGAFVAIVPSLSVILTPDRAYIGTRLGMAVAITSIGALTGAPIGGAIVRSGGWSSAWVYGGSLFAGCALFMLASRIVKFGWKPVMKI